jgi:hypothetical protein
MKWSDVVNKHKSAIAKLETEIKGYSYGDDSQTISTDEKFCAWLVVQLRHAKKKLFIITETLYGMHLESKLDKLAEDLKNAIDIFSDEIKVRHIKCKPSPLFEELVRHDIEIVNSMKDMNSNLEKLYDQMMAGLKQPYNGRRDTELWQNIKEKLKECISQFDRIVQLFKERDAICNIRPLSLQKTYQLIRKAI